MSVIQSCLQRFHACVPQSYREYTATHMDTIPKLINHLLLFMAVCNLFLFLACFRSAMGPNNGLDTLLISFLLSLQNLIAWSVINNGRLPNSFQALAPSDFMLGVTLGITVGGSILSFVLSLFYGRMSNCTPVPSEDEENITSSSLPYSHEYHDFCDHRGNMVAIWFWSGIVFWINTAVALLIALGRDELTFFAQSNYETIGISMDEFEDSFERFNAQMQRDHNDFVQVGNAVTSEDPSVPSPAP